MSFDLQLRDCAGLEADNQVIYLVQLHLRNRAGRVRQT